LPAAQCQRIGAIFARPYTFRRGPGNGPGPLCNPNGLRRFPREPARLPQYLHGCRGARE